MPSIIVRGVEYQLHPPRRRIYVAEVGRHLGPAQERALSACLGLAARSLWSAERKEPRYTGDALDYGEAVYEMLSDAGWTHTEIIMGGVEAWKTWAPLVVTQAAVDEAAGFTDPHAAATSA